MGQRRAPASRLGPGDGHTPGQAAPPTHGSDPGLRAGGTRTQWGALRPQAHGPLSSLAPPGLPLFRVHWQPRGAVLPTWGPPSGPREPATLSCPQGPAQATRLQECDQASRPGSPHLCSPSPTLSTRRDREGAPPQTQHRCPTPRGAGQRQPHGQNPPAPQERSCLPGLALPPLEGLVPAGHSTRKGWGSPCSV